MNNQEAEAWLNKGYEQHTRGDFLGAIASYDQAIHYQPDFPEAWYNRGIALEKFRET